MPSDYHQILTLPAKWKEEEKKELCQYMPDFHDSLARETELFSMIITCGEMWVYGYKQHTSNSHLSEKTPYLHAQERQDKFAQPYRGLSWWKLKACCPLALTLSLPAHYITFKHSTSFYALTSFDSQRKTDLLQYLALRMDTSMVLGHSKKWLIPQSSLFARHSPIWSIILCLHSVHNICIKVQNSYFYFFPHWCKAWKKKKKRNIW
jgi:hypothetical protein